MEKLKYKANDQYTGIKLTYDGYTPDQRGREDIQNVSSLGFF